MCSSLHSMVEAIAQCLHPKHTLITQNTQWCFICCIERSKSCNYCEFYACGFDLSVLLSHQVLHLSYLLGHSSEPDTSLSTLLTAPSLSEGKGYTVVVLTLSAMQNGDYKLARKMCTVLINCKFGHAWEVCK